MHGRACLAGGWRLKWAAGAALLGAACAAPDAEIHLAPLFSRHTAPDYDHAEVAGGVLRHRESRGAVTWALSPLLWRRTEAGGAEQGHFLYPFGKYEHDPERPRTLVRLFPVFWREAETLPSGVEEIDWAFLPPFFWGGSSSDGKEDYFAFFPLFGTFRNFLTYDEASFFLFPLYLSNRKGERTSQHILWPFFGWTGGSERGWHIFPLYGESEVPGKYRRSYVLWPLAHFTEEELDKPHPRQGWLVVPLGGRIAQDDYTATTALWPIFGTADRPSTGYSAWQVWPLLKFESGGRNKQRKVSRILPFYLHFEDEENDFTAWMWPIFWSRHARFGGTEYDAFYAVPFWWSTTRRREDGTVEDEVRIWPLARAFTSTDGARRFAALAPGLEPLLDSEALSENLGFLFELWSVRRDGLTAPRESRALLDLYHSAESAGHRRWSVPGLGGVWTEPDGTAHYSLLFGLLRFRTGAEGGLEDPAFPGPGWPDLHALSAAPPPGAAPEP